MPTDEYALRVFKQAGLAAYAATPDDNSSDDGSTVQTKSAVSFPIDGDATFMLGRVFPASDSDTVDLNSARPLEHLLVLRYVTQNCGLNDDSSADNNSANFVSADIVSTIATLDIQENITFPSPEKLFTIVWKLIPTFLQQKIKELANENNARAVTQEIYSYVKVALGLLPIPVPGIFIDAAVNLVVPPLVVYIVNTVFPATSDTQSEIKVGVEAFGLGYTATPKTRKMMKSFYCDILLRAGIPASHLPMHLRSLAAQPDFSDDDAGGDDGTDGSNYSSFGEPSERDSKNHLWKFYDDAFLNGCLRMPLTQVIAAQIRTNSKSDQDPLKFGPAVWKTLTADQKTQFKQWAGDLDKYDLANGLYQPVYNILGTSPYNVPDPIRPAFASMKVPEVVAWVIDTYGPDS